MDVDGDIAPAHVVERDGEIAGQDFDRHRSLLLTDAVEHLEPGLKGSGARPIHPKPAHVAAELVRDATRCSHYPARPDGRVTVRHRSGLHGPEDGRLIASQPHRIEMAEAFMECLRRLEGAFCWNALVQEDPKQKREGISPEESFGRLRWTESSGP